MVTTQQQLYRELPPEWPKDLSPYIRTEVHAAGTKLVVLDDDPTGTQTVHDVDVLTDGSIAALTEALADPSPVVYVLTNTRSMSLSQAQALNRDIARNLAAARRATHRRFIVISRSDSTLRGHYPGEISALSEGLGGGFDATLIVPFFAEGGRITAHDVHYVADGHILTPVAETEYARDPVFGYAGATLRDWVSEKHHGVISPADVATLTLDDIRLGGPKVVAQKLLALCEDARRRRSGGSLSTAADRVCIINAVSYRDLEVAVTGVLDAEAQGCTFLYRTAASFVRVRGGIPPRPLLTAAELRPPRGNRGLVIVGSHVPKTTRQVAAALKLPNVAGIELSVPDLLQQGKRDAAIRWAAAEAAGAAQDGKIPVVFTSRLVVDRPEAEANLAVGRNISQAIVDLVRQMSMRPAWLVAKGGITASDIATDALGIRKARVLGQAIPGIPIWRTGPESMWPGLTYVVFPGNVGDDQALARMMELLR